LLQSHFLNSFKNMRNIINISLPSNLTRVVEKEVNEGGYASKSEFFRFLIRLWKEKELAHELNDSRQEFNAGKGKVLKSLKSLR
jgi:Arc/MetJ-type ribon-helix-helix transcriptional regulator